MPEIYSGYGDIEIWDVQTGAKLAVAGGHRYSVSAVQALPDGKRLLTCGLDSITRVWSIEDGHLLRELPRNGASITAASASPDGHYVLTGGRDGVVRVWDVERGMMTREFGQVSLPIEIVHFSDGGSELKAASGYSIMRWNALVGRRIGEAFKIDTATGSPYWSRDLKYAFTDSGTGRYLKFWDLERGSITSVVPQPAETDRKTMGYSADGRYCVVQLDDSACHSATDKDTCDCTYVRWDMTTGQEAGSFQAQDVGSLYGRVLEVSDDGCQVLALRRIGHPELYDFVTRHMTILRDTITGREPFWAWLSPTGQVIMSCYDGTVEFWDTQEARIIRTIRLDSPLIGYILTPDEQFLIGRPQGPGAYSTRTLEVWDANTGRKLQELVGHSDAISEDPSYCPDKRLVASASYDGTARIWSVETGKEIVQFISFRNGEWVAVTPEGYYSSSLNGDAFLNVRTGSKITGIEPYRSTFYQPAVVEAALRLGDSELAVSEVLGCKTSCTTIADMPDMEPPYLTVKYPENNDTLKTTDTTLAFHIEDRHFPIKAVKVYVNGRPITGNPLRGTEDEPTARGIQLDIPKGKKALDLKVPLRLDEGDNLITITATGKSEAVDSLHLFVIIAGTLPEQMEMDTVWILAVGVNNYQDKKLRRLNYCVNDAQGIIEAFTAQEGKTCRKVMSLCISDAGPKKPTYETIVDNIGFLQQAAEHDLVILFLAGHGVNDVHGDFYFLPSDAEVTGPQEFRKSKAISGAQLQTAVDVSARRFVFMDACHSGDVGVDLVKLAREFKDNRVLIMTSSEGNKPSEEADSLKHGLFTYTLIQGLQGDADRMEIDGKVSAMELTTYVSERVAVLTRHRQNPVFWAPGGLSNFVVAVKRTELASATGVE
jgi:WD40 repeat protein